MSVSTDFVDSLWRALRDGPQGARPNAVDSFTRTHAADDYVTRHDFESLLYAAGYKVIADTFGDLFPTLGVQPVHAYLHPRIGIEDAIDWVFPYFIPIGDVAAMLIRLERFGISIDPEPLVSLILTRIYNKPYFAESEYHCWYFKERRHRSAPITLSSDRSEYYARSMCIKTITGYKVYACINEDGEAFHLTTRSPKYRKPTPSGGR